jgi:hypothetical protein
MESLREDWLTQEMTSVPPMPQPQLDDSLLFGIGVNSDAGLTGNIDFSTPIQLAGAFAPPGQFNTVGTGAAQGLLAGITPAGTLTPDLGIPIQPQYFGEAKPDDTDPPASPYPCDRYVPAIGEIDLSIGSAPSLEQLVEAETLYQHACQLVQCGQYTEAMACLKQVSGLCCARRFEEMAAELVSSMVHRVVGDSPAESDAEEQEELPMPCQPYLPESDNDGPRCPADTATSKYFAEEIYLSGQLDWLCPPPNIEMERNLPARVTCTFKNVPLRQAINDLAELLGANIEVDKYALRSDGISLDRPVSLHLEDTPLEIVLERLLKQCGCDLRYIVKEDHIEVTIDAKVRRRLEYGPCPVSDLLKEPGVEEQVTGLMKACHLALKCANHRKAVQLAREAHALDGERVAADPVVYKMHLLALKMNKSDCGCGHCGADCDCGDGCFGRCGACCDCGGDCGCGRCGADCDCGDCPGCRGCCVKKVVKGCCKMGGRIVKNKACPCVRVEMRRPSLPPVDPAIVVQLQKLIVEEDGEVAKAKPALEVVEEEPETMETPKALAKPFRVRSLQTGTVLTCDDLLRCIPGETWTEYDPKTNHLRVLWRMRVGSMVYRMRYDGDVSVDVVVTPAAGDAERCEELR